jgi:hypothetical protein
LTNWPFNAILLPEIYSICHARNLYKWNAKVMEADKPKTEEYFGKRRSENE